MAKIKSKIYSFISLYFGKYQRRKFKILSLNKISPHFTNFVNNNFKTNMYMLCYLKNQYVYLYFLNNFAL